MRLVILDRDGVINQDSDDYVKSPEEWIPLPGSLEAIAQLTRAGFSVVVASNQSGVGRGLFDLATLERIHEKMRSAVAQKGGRIAVIYYGPHHPDDHCACRKPKPGLLRQIGTQFGTDLDGVPFIGDSLRDIQAARAVGARPILVRTGYGEQTLARLERPLTVEVYPDLATAATHLINETRP